MKIEICERVTEDAFVALGPVLAGVAFKIWILFGSPKRHNRKFGGTGNEVGQHVWLKKYGQYFDPNDILEPKIIEIF